MLLKIIIALAIILMYYDDSKVADAGWLASNLIVEHVIHV